MCDTADASAGVKPTLTVTPNAALLSFTSLADFQYSATASIGGGEAAVGPYGAESEPLLLVPPAFSQRDQPVDYAFRDFRAADGRQTYSAAAPSGTPATGMPPTSALRLP